MDKDILAVIGRLYLENLGLFNTIDSLQKRIEKLENNTSSENKE